MPWQDGLRPNLPRSALLNRDSLPLALISRMTSSISAIRGSGSDVLLSLVTGTMLGSARLLAETGEPPESLRADVTSPGGTTAAGLGVLEAGAVRGSSAFVEAVAAATERSRQLGH